MNIPSSQQQPRARAIVGLISQTLSITCDLDLPCTVVDGEEEFHKQEFLILLFQKKLTDGMRGIFLAQSQDDEAIMLQSNPEGALSWALYNPEVMCLDLFLKLNPKCPEKEFELTTVRNGVTEYLVISAIRAGIASLSFSKDPTNSLHFQIKDFFLLEDGSEEGVGAGEDEEEEKEDDNEELKGKVEAEMDAPEIPENIVIANFEAGSLGLTLRRKNDGVVYAHEVDPGLQADQNHIQAGSLLWSVGSHTLGNKPVTKEQWTSLVKYIQSSPRPLQMLFQIPPPMTSSTSTAVKPPDAPLVTAPSNANQDGASAQPQSPPLSSPTSSTSSLPSSSLPSSPLSEQESADIVSLKRIAARLIFKEKEKPPESSNPKQKISSIVKSKLSGTDRVLALAMEMIVKPGRKLLKHGPIGVPGKMALWNVQNKKFLFLFSDLVLLTAAQGDKFLVESSIDLQTCKINIRVASEQIDPSTVDPKSVFELIHPGGSSILICEDLGSQQAWVQAIYEAICDGVDLNERKRVIGWRHQYISGTMHSAVLSHDIRKVRGLLEACADGEIDPLELETQDEDGYTPLHYSCLLRLTNITRLLHESSADVTIPDSHGLTALHWAALQLDWEALEMLCTHVFHIDILDEKNRSPLYLACVEGRNVQGHTDIPSLIKCVTCLLDAGANPNLKDKEGLSSLHYLSASWQYPVVDAILKFGRSLTKRTAATDSQLSDVNIRADNGGWTPLHYACSGQPIKRAIGEGQRILQSGDSETIIAGNPDHGSELQPWIQSSDGEDMEQTNQADSISTIRILLDHGAIPNLSDFRGRRPLTILADNLYRFVDSFQACLITLTSHGARLEELPDVFRQEDSAIVIQEGQTMWTNKKILNGDEIGLRSDACPPSLSHPLIPPLVQSQRVRRSCLI
jgi:hypothetical protein